jgi:hypothetical protein
MKTKEQLIAELKTEFPTLQTGNDQDGYVQLSADEYDATISEWADVRLAQAKAEADAELKAQAKAVLLERLGLTQEEFNTLTA